MSARLLRLAGLRAALSSLGVVALASCGGGSSAPVVVVPPPLACQSTAGGGSGYALGACGTTGVNVFQPIPETVAIGGVDSYVLALDFPAHLPQALDEPGVSFLAANKPPADERNIVGALRGQAYESPNNAVLQPPFVALTDFYRSWHYLTPVADPPAQALAYASFGTWEKFPLVSNATEGYTGPWYAGRSLAPISNWPTGAARSYAGYVVGVIGPDGSAGAALGRLYGFSAPVALSVDGAGSITAGQVGPLVISFQAAGQTGLTTQTLSINTISFVQTGGVSPGQLLGSLQALAGAGAGLRSGEFEARYFGAVADFGAEIAGRFRFTTTSGLVAVAAFGAKRQ